MPAAGVPGRSGGYAIMPIALILLIFFAQLALRSCFVLLSGSGGTAQPIERPDEPIGHE
jgi:hypothetical protein